MMTGGDIIALKDNIHTKWFELQGSKRSDDKYAFLQRPVYDEIVRLGHEALDALKELDPQSLFIERVEKPLNEVEWKSLVAEDIRTIATVPYYVMTPERGQDVITQDINRLANEIHNAGMSLIKANGRYCGCKIVEDIRDLSSINTGVLRYCEGALRLEGTKAWIQAPGDHVEHKPGTVRQHANLIQFVPTEKGYNLAMEYMESGEGQWPSRMEGVTAFVRKMGGQCEGNYQSTKCEIENVSDEDILSLALVISQLKDVDLMDISCIPMAFELIAKQAEELKKVEPKENIWQERWTRVEDMSEVMDCQGQAYAEEAGEERGRRHATLYERLENNIEAMDDAIIGAIKHSKKKPCTAFPYVRLAESDHVGSIHDDCQQIKTDTDESWAWCMSLAERREKEIKAAAEELVKRCPPEGIILGLETGGYAGRCDIKMIDLICERIGDQDCLDIIRQVEARAEARAEAGIKPAKLELLTFGMQKELSK